MTPKLREPRDAAWCERDVEGGDRLGRVTNKGGDPVGIDEEDGDRERNIRNR